LVLPPFKCRVLCGFSDTPFTSFFPFSNFFLKGSSLADGVFLHGVLFGPFFPLGGRLFPLSLRP